MNRAQRDLAAAVIEANATTIGFLMRTNGKTCAIGSLLAAAGIPAKPDSSVPTNRERKTLQEVYGIDGPFINVLTSTNDDYPSTKPRRLALLRALDQMVEEDDSVS